MDMLEEKTEKPYKVNYHVSEWFDDTAVQLADVVKTFMERNK